MKKVLFMLLAISAISYSASDVDVIHGGSRVDPTVSEDGKIVTTSSTINVGVSAIVMGPNSGLIITDGTNQIAAINFHHELKIDKSGNVTTTDGEGKVLSKHLYAESDLINAGDNENFSLEIGGTTVADGTGKKSVELTESDGSITMSSDLSIASKVDEATAIDGEKAYTLTSTMPGTAAAGVYAGATTLTITFSKTLAIAHPEPF